ncbi:MAG: hypothetical protein A3I61_17215 [Acidobacteria bacterium RIFCSPLOWO2_02_FULL_68_18]|nr:MAG: hypothetical protein A3I61_17215 [Acidobacteria bacterium RIFCSPLOWO2_02_FULL_68_18]
MILKDVLQTLEDPSAPPGDLSAVLIQLSAEYSRKTDAFVSVLARKADTWVKLRADRESDKQADKAWDATLEGRLETSLRLELKSLEKLMSAIKAHLRVKETEARNQF